MALQEKGRLRKFARREAQDITYRTKDAKQGTRKKEDAENEASVRK